MRQRPLPDAAAACVSRRFQVAAERFTPPRAVFAAATFSRSAALFACLIQRAPMAHYADATLIRRARRHTIITSFDAAALPRAPRFAMTLLILIRFSPKTATPLMPPPLRRHARCAFCHYG